MVNRVAGCQPRAGATPLLGCGLPPLLGGVGKVLAPGSASGKHPFVLSVFVWPWLCCVVGAVLALGCGVVGLWWCLACVPCLLAALVVHGWIARVVGLAPAVDVGR